MAEGKTPRAPWDAFEGGAVTERELRLSKEELAALRRDCPGAAVHRLNCDGGDKDWYRIRLEGATASHG